MVLIIIKTLTRVRQRGANYFDLQPYRAVIICVGNTTRLSSDGQSRANHATRTFSFTKTKIDDTILFTVEK